MKLSSQEGQSGWGQRWRGCYLHVWWRKVQNCGSCRKWYPHDTHSCLAQAWALLATIFLSRIPFLTSTPRCKIIVTTQSLCVFTKNPREAPSSLPYLMPLATRRGRWYCFHYYWFSAFQTCVLAIRQTFLSCSLRPLLKFIQGEYFYAVSIGQSKIFFCLL